ncbi:MAG TPA: AEC family transporter [Bauldia sp.]|nr:AEC family transporter [Bauldia sp.]
MIGLLTLLVPFFGVVALGYGAGRARLVSGGLEALEFFVFSVALPALFFHLITTAPPLAGGWAFVATTTFATYCAFAIAFSIGALVNGGNVPEATIEGLVGSFSNTAYLAPALVIAALGTVAAAPVALIYSFDTALLLIVTPLMMALGGTTRTDLRHLGIDIARQVLLNPVIVATLLAFLAAAFGLRMPVPIDSTLAFIGNAAAPGALFLLGANLATRAFGPIRLEQPLIVAVKLIAHPLIVYLLLSWVGGFDPLWMSAAILIAALPPSVGVVGIAGRYRIYAAHASVSVLIGSLAAVVTLTVAVVLVVQGLLPGDPFR